MNAMTPINIVRMPTAIVNFTDVHEFRDVTLVLTRLNDGQIGFEVRASNLVEEMSRIAARGSARLTLFFGRDNSYAVEERHDFAATEVIKLGCARGRLKPIADISKIHKTRLFLGGRSDFSSDIEGLEYLVRGECSHPTEIKDDDTPLLDDGVPVRRIRNGGDNWRRLPQVHKVEGAGSLIHTLVDDSVSGVWRLVFRHGGRETLEMPLLLLNPKLTTRGLLDDKRLAAAVLPEAFRQVVTAMVMHRSMQETTWFSVWRRFLQELLQADSLEEFFTGDPDGEFGGENLCPMDVEERVDQAVGSYISRLKEVFEFDAVTETESEEI